MPAPLVLNYRCAQYYIQVFNNSFRIDSNLNAACKQSRFYSICVVLIKYNVTLYLNKIKSNTLTFSYEESKSLVCESACRESPTVSFVMHESMPPSMPSTGVLPIIPTTLSCNGVSFSGGGPPPVFRDYLRTKAACFFGIAGTSASFFPKFIDASLMVCICSIHFPSYIFPNFNF